MKELLSMLSEIKTEVSFFLQSIFEISKVLGNIIIASPILVLLIILNNTKRKKS